MGVIQDLTCKAEVLQTKYTRLLHLENNTRTHSQVLLTKAMDEYLRYLQNDKVPAHEIKDRSPQYISYMRYVLSLLRDVIKTRYDLASYMVSDIDSELVGLFYVAIENKHYSNKSFNNQRTNINSFEIWLVHEGYLDKRHFVNIKRKPLFHAPQAISKKEFDDFINIITPLTGAHIRKGIVTLLTKKYQPWLTTAYKIALELGARRNEIILLKFKHIIEENKKPVFIRLEDQKSNRQRKIKDEINKKYNAFPISRNLLKILKKLGYDKKRGKDEYVLLPKITDLAERQKRIANIMTESFRYYYKKLNTGRRLSFKCLRTTSVTSKFILTNGHPEFLTGHNSSKIANIHYVDKEAVAKFYTKKGFKVFD